MAWKKVIVSGSNAHLNSVTASGLSGDADELVIIGSNGELQGSTLTLQGSTFGIGNNSITSSGASSILTGSFTGSFTGDGSGLSGVTAEWDGTHTGNGIITGSLIVSGSSGATVDFTGVDSISGSIFSGSFVGDGSGLTGLATALSISGSTGNDIIDLGSEHLSIIGTANQVNTEVTANQVQIGLPNDVIIPNDLTVTGNLTIQGTTTTISTANLLIEDKFILLNSGSNPAAEEGGIVINSGSGAGHAFVYDADTARFGFTGSLGSSATAVTPDAYAAAVVLSDITEYQKTGNIRVESNEIYIWV